MLSGLIFGICMIHDVGSDLVDCQFDTVNRCFVDVACTHKQIDKCLVDRAYILIGGVYLQAYSFRVSHEIVLRGLDTFNNDQRLVVFLCVWGRESFDLGMQPLADGTRRQFGCFLNQPFQAFNAEEFTAGVGGLVKTVGQNGQDIPLGKRYRIGSAPGSPAAHPPSARPPSAGGRVRHAGTG